MPLDDPRLLRLVDRERWWRDATGALVGPRPPADITYRLAAWYRVPGVTVGQVAALLQRLQQDDIAHTP